jgi:hypothetical protein
MGRPTPGVEPKPVEETTSALDEYLRQAALNRQPRVPTSTSTIRLGAGPKVREEATRVQTIEFDSEIYAVKMNAAGDWLVTLKVPYASRESIVGLSAVSGMNMKTRMVPNGLAD